MNHLLFAKKKDGKEDVVGYYCPDCNASCSGGCALTCRSSCEGYCNIGCAEGCKGGAMI